MLPLLLVVLAVWYLPAAPALGSPPGTAMRTVALDDLLPTDRVGTLSTDAWTVTPPRPAGDVVMVGADWGGDDDTEVQVRTRRDGAWSAWHPLTIGTDHMPDLVTMEAARIERTATDPLWVGPSDDLQFRIRGDATDVSLDLVEVAGGDGLAWRPAELRARGSVAGASVAQPGILSRASWGADESLVNDSPRYSSRVRFSVVHHTAGDNDYGPNCERADDAIRGILRYHTGKGWDDIAYNFLIDPCGNVYEGRAGGIREAVVGAHAAGWNGGSVGVSLLGNFDKAEPPAVMLEALDRLVAWKLDLHHVDPHGTTEEIAGGGSSNRYKQGARVTLPTIIGHRTTNKTTCPGNLVFERVIGTHGHSALADRVDAIGHPKAYGGPPARRVQPQVGIRPRWDVTFTEPTDWSLRIRDAQGALVRATGGTGASSLALAWDMKSASGAFVPAGTYVAELTGSSVNGSVTPIRTEITVTEPATRNGGTNRVETAVEQSRWAFDGASRVVIASAEAFPDALVATPLAGSLGSPVLLVGSDGVPAAVAAEIARLGARTAYVIGGTARLGKAVEDGLKRAGIRTIERLAGPTRFDTAAAVARKVIEREGAKEILLALGAHDDPNRAFPDALAAGAFGASFDAPVLLTAPNDLTGPSRALIAEKRFKKIGVFGGPNAVPAAVESDAATAAGGASVFRFAGGDRYDTARLAADEALARWAERVAANGGPSPYFEPTGLEVVLASGENWPDALGAGAAAAQRGAPFLLVASASLDHAAATRTWLRSHATELARAVVSGGPAAVSDAVLGSIREEVRALGPHLDPAPVWSPDPHAGQPTP